MLMRSSELKRNAKRTLSGGYWSCVLTSLVLGIAAGTSSVGGTYKVRSSDIKDGSFNAYFRSVGIQDIFRELDIPYYMLGTFLTVFTVVMILAVLISIFLLQPLEVGCRKFFIQAGKGEYYFGYMGSAFSSSYMNVVKIMLLRWIFTFLWSLLFIIPGIVKSYEYRMIPYILAEDPSLPSNEVFRRSREMMYGDKMNAFWFDMSFILWFILSGLTFGLAGVFFVDPYYNNSCTELYTLLSSKVRANVYPGFSGNPYPYGGQSGTYGYSSGTSVSSPSATQPYGGNTGQTPYGGNTGQTPYGGSTGQTPTGGTIPAEDAKPFDRPYGE